MGLWDRQRAAGALCHHGPLLGRNFIDDHSTNIRKCQDFITDLKSHQESDSDGIFIFLIFLKMRK